MNNPNSIVALSESSPSVQAHLNILQSVIQRMSANSSSSKAWCIAIVSAILVMVADKSRPEFAWIALIPLFLFLALDAYYLALEKSFRLTYNNFVDKIHSGQLETTDLYSVELSGNLSRHQVEAFKSFSIWGFYGVLAILVIVAQKYLFE